MEGKTEAEIEQEQIANLQLIINLKKRALKIAEIPPEVRTLIDVELIAIAAIECQTELSKLDKIRQNRQHYTAIKELNVDFWKQIVAG